jgi:hypothetical protein
MVRLQTCLTLSSRSFLTWCNPIFPFLKINACAFDVRSKHVVSPGVQTNAMKLFPLCFLLLFSSWGPTFKSLIYFELISYESNFILLRIQFSQHHLLKKLSSIVCSQHLFLKISCKLLFLSSLLLLKDLGVCFYIVACWFGYLNFTVCFEVR